MDDEPTNSQSTTHGYERESGLDNEATEGGWTFEAQAQYDPTDSGDLTTVIIKTIAEAEGVPMTEILSPPLYDVIDVAAMESALFGRQNVSKNGTDSAVEFRYNGHKVSVEADGWVTVSRRSDGQTTDQS